MQDRKGDSDKNWHSSGVIFVLNVIVFSVILFSPSTSLIRATGFILQNKIKSKKLIKKIENFRNVKKLLASLPEMFLQH